MSPQHVAASDTLYSAGLGFEYMLGDTGSFFFFFPLPPFTKMLSSAFTYQFLPPLDLLDGVNPMAYWEGGDKAPRFVGLGTEWM